MNTFNELEVKSEILKALNEMGFSEPTPIQSQIIPYVLEGKDCLAQAPTGTGKTCAFGIPLVNMVDTDDSNIQAIIMCPTRELAMQTEAELKKICKFLPKVKILAIYGGQNFQRQLQGLKRNPQIIVGTPGRVLDHLRRRTLKINSTKIMVLDEADEMLNMGFREDIDTILQNMPGHNQTVLFSATMSKEILQISKSYQKDPVSVKTTIKEADLPEIKQYFVKLRENGKLDAFKRIMSEKDYKYVLVFCNTKRKVDELNKKLNDENFLSDALHGDLRQRQRDVVMRHYRTKQINILVATDVAARGIDVDDIEAVFNYDLPIDDEYYIHRIGRTARANKKGTSYSFTTAQDIHRVREIEKFAKCSMEELILGGLTDEKLGAKKAKSFDSPSVRLFLNIGTKDNLNSAKLSTYICNNTSIRENDIFEVKALDMFSFLEVAEEKSKEVIGLTGTMFGKRRLSVEVAGSKEAKPKKDFKSRSNSSSSFSNSSSPAPRFDGANKFRGNSSSKPFNRFDKPARKSEGFGDEVKTEFKTESSYRGGSDYKKDYKSKPSFTENGERKPYPKKTFGDKKPYGDKKPSFASDGDFKKDYKAKPSFASDGDFKKDYKAKPSFASDGEKKPYPKKTFGDKKPYGDKKPSFPSKFGDKPSFEKSSERKSDSDFRVKKTRSFDTKKAYRPSFTK